MKTYIHYGNSEMHNITPITEIRMNKPRGGLWASPIDSDCSWKDWCEGEQFELDRLNKHFTFSLKSTAKILTIHSYDDIPEEYIQIPPKDGNVYTLFELFNDTFKEHKTDKEFLNWEQIISDYDGFEIYFNDDYCEFHEGAFHQWDCDSLVLWNNVIDKVS